MDQIPLPQDFKDLLKLLHAHGVKHLLIGGWAVGYHGYPRNTAGNDIWYAANPENAHAIVNMLRDFIGTAPTPEELLNRPLIFRMGNVPNRVELLTDIAGVDFEQCFMNRVNATLDDVPVTVIGLQDLLKNKRASGRDKDLIDAKQLEKYHRIAARENQQ
jgi:hypothetical protein